MPYSRDYIKNFLEGIRDERLTGANTAQRIGKAFLMLFDLLTGNDAPFLRKDQDDETPHGLTMAWLRSKGNAVIDGLLTAYNAVINNIRSSNYTGDGVADTGWALTNDYAGGHSRLVVDYIYARMKLIAEALEIKETLFSAGDQSWSRAGNEIMRTDYLDDGGNVIGYTEQKVPWTLKGMPFMLRKTGFFGIFSRLRKIRVSLNAEDLTSVRRVRCYFLAKDGEREVHNLWSVGDLVRCQTFNLATSKRNTYTTITQKAGNVFWWRRCCGVSQDAVTLDGKEYHYLDLEYNYIEEQTAYAQGRNTGYAACQSDLPCAGDKAVQFGHVSDPGRMNLLSIEVNGELNADAPCVKAYRGIYSFDLSKCWWGGASCLKMKLSPATGYEFYGPMFKFVTEYGVAKVPVNRGTWLSIVTERDDYGEHTQVRKLYYYNQVTHKGSLWLCINSQIADHYHWVDENGNAITDAAYTAKTDVEKALCSHVPDYVTSEPSETSSDWLKQVAKGDTPTPQAAYQWNTSQQTAPSLPANNTSIDELTNGWTKNAPNRPADNQYLWMTTRNSFSDGSYTNWAQAICITGGQGTAGEDAKEREWIFRLDTNTDYDGKAGTASGQSVSGQTDGVYNCYLKDDFVPTGWSGNPTGISNSHKTEYGSWRDFDKTTKRWGDFHTPIIWSHYGERGMDGDGVEYVFMRTTKNVAPVLDSTQEGYNADEFRPTITNSAACGAESTQTTDDPKGTSDIYLYEWVVKRSKTAPDADGRRAWTKFTGENGDYKMSLWANWSKDGENVVRLDISNEMDMLQTDSTGKILAGRTVNTVVHLYDGGTEVDISDKTIGLANSPSTPALSASGKGRKLSWTFSAGDTLASSLETTLSYSYKGVPYQAVITFVPSLGQAIYQLKPLQTAIVFTRGNDGNFVDNSKTLTVKVLKIDGQSTAELNAYATGLNVRYSFVSMPEYDTGDQLSGRNDILVTNICDTVYLALFNAANVLLDRETIPVIKDGQKGQDGHDGLDGYDGQDGADGLTVTLSRHSIILEQQIVNNSADLDLTNAYTDVTVKRGNNPVGFSISNVACNHGTATVQNGSRVKVTEINLVSDTTKFYAENLVTFNVVVGNATFPMSFNVYVNNVQTFKREIQDGVETAVGEKIGFDELEEGQTLKDALTAEITTSASGLRQEFSEEISRANPGNPNLFGFHKGVEFNNFIPFIQGYGIVSGSGQCDIRYLGFGGETGYYTVSFEAKMLSSSKNITFSLDANGEVANNKTITTSWTRYTLTFNVTGYGSSSFGLFYISGMATSNRIVIRHLKIERGRVATAFCEADEDIAYRGNSNLIGTLWNNGMTASEDLDGHGAGYYLNINPPGYSGDYVDYLREDHHYNLIAGKCYTLSFWAKCTADGMKVVSYLYKSGYSLITNITNNIYTDTSIQEGVKDDGETVITLSTEWKQYFIHWYAAASIDAANLIVARVNKSMNSGLSGTLYIAGIRFCEGYEMPYATYKSLLEQSARRFSMSVYDGLQRTGLDIESGIIRLGADNTYATGNFHAPRVLSENDDMITTIEAGVLEVRSKNSYSYGRFWINSLNEVILQLFDKDGHCVLNIGGSPNAIVAGRWTTVKLKKVANAGASGNSISGDNCYAYASDCTPFYQLTLGQLRNSDNTLQYFLPAGNETTNASVIARDGCTFTQGGVSTDNAVLGLSYIPDGWYVEQNDGVFQVELTELPLPGGGPIPYADSKYYYCTAYKYEDGKSTQICLVKVESVEDLIVN